MLSNRSDQERRTFLVALGSFLVFTAAVVVGGLRPLDAALATPGVQPRSLAGQLAEGFALLSHPFGLFGLVLLFALWALKRRLRRLAGALALCSLGLPAYELAATLCAQPRPLSLFADSVSARGFGYPSGNVAAATILTWVAVTLVNAQRRTRWTAHRRRLLGGLLVVAVAAGEWVMNTQFVSGIVGGALLGITVASGALWVSGVDTVRRSLVLRDLPAQRVDKRAAIVYNPTKVLDLDMFRRRVEHALLHNGWKPPLWLETTREDAGTLLARGAAAQGVDLVLVAGGDGTVRAVCAGLAGTGVPVGLVPAGTGNLLCRNLGIPLDEDAALDVALNGHRTGIDLITCATDDTHETFAVMSGLGLDARIMSETSTELKKTIKNGAYVLAAVQQVGMKPFQVRVVVDGHPFFEGPTVMTLVGNVGRLQGGLEIFPAASPVDGLLDILIASPDGLRAWGNVLASLRSGGSVQGLTRTQGRHVEIIVERPIDYQLDGDSAGTTSTFTAQIAPLALTAMRPQEAPPLSASAGPL